MKVGVVAESRSGERRVALVPEHVQRLVADGHQVIVQRGAGLGARADDEAYVAAGAQVAEESEVLGADLVVHVAALDPARVARLRTDAATLGFCAAVNEAPTVRAALDRGVASFAFELLPRISRAQSMDALSSQALVSGYRAGLVAADRLPRFFPLLMTAAGTVPPAKVLVLGAGVAGLQAIATARRLGAVVEAFDVRAAAAEEVRSMGASFVELDLDSLEGTGGYAREMTDDRAARQRELLAPFVAASDALILTAAVPGRRAPLLVTGEMIAEMKPGSVVVDLAAESGGNCDVSVAGEEIQHHGVAVWGARDVPSQLPVHSSKLYSANVTALLALLCGEDGALAPRWEDEIVAGCWVTRDGTLHEGITLPEGGLMDGIGLLTVFVLSVFVGFEVISKVSTTLHTPLMSGANAIHGVILVGAIIVTGQAQGLELVLGLIAVVLATVNMVGGFVVTDRMLQMFKPRQAPRASADERPKA